MNFLNHANDSLEKVPLCDCRKDHDDSESESSVLCEKRHGKLRSFFHPDKNSDTLGSLFHGDKSRRKSLEATHLSVCGQYSDDLNPVPLDHHDKYHSRLKSLFHHDKGRRKSYAFERLPLRECEQQHDKHKSLFHCDKEHGLLRAFFHHEKEDMENETDGGEEPVEFEGAFFNTSSTEENCMDSDNDDKEQDQHLENTADINQGPLEGTLIDISLTESEDPGDDSDQEENNLEKEDSTSDEEEGEVDTSAPNSVETDDEQISSTEESEEVLEDEECEKMKEFAEGSEKRQESSSPCVKDVDKQKSDTATSLLSGVKTFYKQKKSPFASDKSKSRHKGKISVYNSNMELETQAKPKNQGIKKRFKRKKPAVKVVEKVEKPAYNEDDLEKQMTALFDDVKIRYNLMEPSGDSKSNEKKSSLKIIKLPEKHVEHGQDDDKVDVCNADVKQKSHKDSDVSFSKQGYDRPLPLVQGNVNQGEEFNGKFRAILFNTFGGKQRGIPGLKSATSVLHVYSESVLVTDMLDSKVVLYDRSGRVRQTFMGKEHSEPWAAVMTPDGHVLVTLRRDGCFALWPKDASSTKMFGHSELKCPAGIAVDKQRRIIVTDERAHDVFLYDNSGRYLFKLSDLKQTTFKQPRYVCVSASGRIIVSDSGNHSVKVFNMDGEFLFQLGSYGSGEGKLKFPYGVCVDHEEHIIVADHYNDRIVMFSSEGHFMQTLISHRPGMIRPQGVSVRCAHNRTLYITHGEYRASEVIVFKLISHKSELSVSIEQFA